MHKIKDIVTDVLNGCTANNLVEWRMRFRVNYYVNDTKCYCLVYKVQDLEEAIFNIIKDNLSSGDVTIAEITVKNGNEIIRVNKHNYPYKLDYFLNMLLSK